MRFHFLLTAFLLFALASGLVIPPRISEREADTLETRQFIAKDFDDVDGRSIFGLVKGALGAVKGIGKVAKSVVGAVKGVAKSAGGIAKKAGSAVKSVASKTKGVAKKAASSTKNVAKKATASTKNVAKKAATKTKSAAKNVGTKAKKAGTKIKDAVNPNGPKAKYHVPAGGGKPAQTYSRKDVKKAVKDANTEHQRHKAGLSGNQKKKSPLKPFGNNNHHVQKPGSPGPNSLPKMKGKGYEYPLKNTAQAAGNPKDKGPARVITQENKKGKLKFKGVVAHDQNRKQGDPGHNDHFQIKGSRK